MKIREKYKVKRAGRRWRIIRETRYGAVTITVALPITYASRTEALFVIARSTI